MLNMSETLLKLEREYNGMLTDIDSKLEEHELTFEYELANIHSQLCCSTISSSQYAALNKQEKTLSEEYDETCAILQNERQSIIAQYEKQCAMIRIYEEQIALLKAQLEYQHHAFETHVNSLEMRYKHLVASLHQHQHHNTNPLLSHNISDVDELNNVLNDMTL
jgi:hypothetical protein